ncbi:uncharacterized protein LOC126265783 [Aethina tumida]|uniref:uncharacterized protein LOC126265783 n=1 Tax=Aethina tumida TaxID=116153 RepID=UPI0021491DC1|nr:uncharacterized protein LOC126265783 [Aethina tumida]
MYIIRICIILSYCSIIWCDWVEITQVKGTNYTLQTEFPLLETPSTIQKPFVSTTTPSSYEIVMRTPYYNDLMLTIAPSNQLQRKIGNKGTTVRVTPTVDTTSPPISVSFPTENITEEILEDEKQENDETKENWKFDSFIPMVKTIQKTLMKDQDKSVTNKIAVLKNLRDKLLWNIGDKMTNLWGPSDQNRQARGYKDEHHMDFPSNEGALMTIGFLTFAVFLIKLVLVKFYFMVPLSFIIKSGLKCILPGKYDTKLIYALKYKQQYYMTTTTTAATVFIRRQRDIDEDENARILKLIEEFRLD